MDATYDQYSSHHTRRKIRSTTNLNHLSLAPLTTRLPVADDDDAFADYLSVSQLQHTTSYLQRKSAPSTPGILTRSPGRSRSRDRLSAPTTTLPKSKSAIHVWDAQHGSHRVAAANTKRRRDGTAELARGRNDSDWLLRAGALIGTETRESKGQAWLTTRESSASLTGLRDEEEHAYQREMDRERELASRIASHQASRAQSRAQSRAGSRNASRRGSLAPGDDLNFSSPPGSRLGSRSHSRVSHRSQMLTPGDRRPLDGYFHGAVQPQELDAGPDFVNLDEELDVLEADSSAKDEEQVRMIMKREKTSGVGSWFGSVLGWPLFAVQENDEDWSDADESEDTETEVEEAHFQKKHAAVRQLEGSDDHMKGHIPAPDADEGGWQDAAWLLSVASRVIL